VRLWFLTNGHGEDRATALVAAAVAARQPDVDIRAATLVTQGAPFASRGVPVVVHGIEPPSGGFPTASLAALLRDLPAAPAYLRYVQQIRRLAHRDDVVVAAGDTFLLGLARFAFRTAAVHLALAKSVHGQPHSRVEHAILRRWTSLVFARDDATADALRSHGVRAEFHGNPLVDGLPLPVRPSTDPPLIVMLPGSRIEAPANLVRLLAVASLVAEPAIWVCAWPETVARERGVEAAAQAGWRAHGDCLTHGGVSVRLARGEFEQVLPAAEVVLGLAGTANEQAAALGKPVVTCVGAGPQTCAKRMREQERLLGGSARHVDGPASAVAAELSSLLRSPGERDHRGRLGMARLGPPGAALRIADRLLAHFAQSPRG
jgi:uncharacterized protein (TIGR03492 family)